MDKITRSSDNLLKFIEKFEGLSLKPYKCSAGVPTIGFGSTYYENGSKVTMNDPAIDKARAYELLRNTLTQYEKNVDSYCIDSINQNQFDALVSFAYNCGSNALKSSTLLKKVNINPNDPAIKNEFLKWVLAAGKKIKGLENRRNAEIDLYFKK